MKADPMFLFSFSKFYPHPTEKTRKSRRQNFCRCFLFSGCMTTCESRYFQAQSSQPIHIVTSRDAEPLQCQPLPLICLKFLAQRQQHVLLARVLEHRKISMMF